MLRQIIASLIFASSACIALHGQASPTAERLALIQIGGGLNIVSPDYNPGTIKGYSVYGSFDFSRHFGIEGDVHRAMAVMRRDRDSRSFDGLKRPTLR